METASSTVKTIARTRVPDVEDACPDVPGRRHPDPNRNGCPDVLIGTTEVTVFHKILFKTNSAEILPESNPILDKVADALNAHPDLVLIEVAGHADERGTPEYNLSLGETRAKSARKYLTALGIEEKRMKVVSYGEEKPINNAGTEAAFAENRRAELNVRQ